MSIQPPKYPAFVLTRYLTLGSGLLCRRLFDASTSDRSIVRG